MRIPSIAAGRGRLAAAFLTALATLALAAPVASRQKTEAEKRPSQSSKSIQVNRLASTYYDVEQFQGTLMLNNKGPRDIEVEVILRSLSGHAMRLQPLMVGGNQIGRFDLAALAGQAGHDFRQGRIELSHSGKWLEVGAQLTLAHESLMFSEQLIDPDRDFGSTQLHGLWWRPRSQSEILLALVNRTNQPLEVDVSALAEGMLFQDQVLLKPQQTRLLPLDQLFEARQGDWPSAGGLTAEHDGDPGDLLARAFILDRPIGFSHQVGFFDPARAASNRYHGAGFRVSPFLGQAVEPLILARNLSQKASRLQVRIPLTDRQGNHHLVELPTIELQPDETRDLSGRAHSSLARLAARLEESPGSSSGGFSEPGPQREAEAGRDRLQSPLMLLRGFSAGLEFEYTGSPGDVMVEAASLSRDRDHIFAVTTLDAEAAPVSAGGIPWTVAGGQTTLLHFKNTSSEELLLLYRIDFPGDVYAPDFLTLAPGESRSIDVRQLQQEQIPDSQGVTIPLQARGGQVLWSLKWRQEQIRAAGFRPYVGIIARGEYIDLASGLSSTYSCFNCCCDSFSGSLSPGSGNGLVGQTQSFTAIQNQYSCYGSHLGSYQVTPEVWSSSSTQVATISNGVANCSGAGSTNIGAGWWEVECYIDGYNDCLPEEVWIGPIAPMCVYNVNISGPSSMVPGGGNTTTVPEVTLTVNLGKTPPTAQTVTLRTDVTLKSGGHEHETSSSKRPLPMLQAPNSTTWKEGTLNVQTSQSSFQVKFRPPMGKSSSGVGNHARGIAGSYQVKADFLGTSNVASHSIDAKYSLQKLGTGSNYHLRSNDSRHNNGDYHWGTSSANTAAKDAAAQFWTVRGMNQNPQEKMIINDQSLKWGGLFEVPGTVAFSIYTSSSGLLGHQTHRDGKYVDVPYRVYKNGSESSVAVNSAPWNKLKEALDAKFSDVQREDSKNHFHARKD